MRNVGCLFLLSLVCLFACKDETRENPPLKGDAFWLANPWKFYFVDAEGKSVLRLKAGAVLPLTGMEVPGDPEVIPADFVPDRSGEYNYKHNSVGYDHEKGLYYWRTSVPGNIGVTPSRFYVRFDRNDVDTVRVLFKFTSGAAVGGDGIEVSVREQHCRRHDDAVVIVSAERHSRRLKSGCRWFYQNLVLPDGHRNAAFAQFRCHRRTAVTFLDFESFGADKPAAMLGCRRSKQDRSKIRAVRQVDTRRWRIEPRQQRRIDAIRLQTVRGRR